MSLLDRSIEALPTRCPQRPQRRCPRPRTWRAQAAVPGAQGGTTGPVRAQPVEDVATPPAIDAQTYALSSKLDAIREELAAMRDGQRQTVQAINGLKRNGAFRDD